MKGKTVKIAAIVGAALLVVVAVGAAIFAGSQIISAQAQSASQNLLGLTLNPVAQVQTQTPGASTDKGLVVVIVNANGPAAAAGVKRGDILLSINETAVNSYADLRNVLSGVKAGDTVTLSVTHGDTPETLSLVLGNNNGSPDLGLVPFGGGLRGGKFFGGGQPGAVIVSVDANSPASQAGLKAGDRILSVDGTTLGAANTLASLLASHKSGDKVTLHVMSGTTASDVPVTLGDKNGKAYLGIQYNEFDGGLRGLPGKQFSLPQGVKAGIFVNSVVSGSPAEKAGLQVHDLITSLDGTAVTTTDAFIQAIAAKKPGDTVTLTVYHMNSQTSADVKVTLGDNPQSAGKAYMGVTLFDLSQFKFNTGPNGSNGNNGNNGNNGSNGGSGFPFRGQPFRRTAPSVTGNNA